MSGTEIVGLVAELVNKNNVLEDRLSKSVPIDKFYDTALTTEVVGALHGVSAGIVRRYIKLKLIPTHPMSTDAKILVRGSVALSIDFDKLRYQAKFLNK